MDRSSKAFSTCGIPREVLKGGSGAVLSYFRNLMFHGQTKCNRMRLVFVGNGNVGKVLPGMAACCVCVCVCVCICLCVWRLLACVCLCAFQSDEFLLFLLSRVFFSFVSLCVVPSLSPSLSSSLSLELSLSSSLFSILLYSFLDVCVELSSRHHPLFSSPSPFSLLYFSCLAFLCLSSSSLRLSLLLLLLLLLFLLTLHVNTFSLSLFFCRPR
jgi:hypothetical protein